VTATIRAGRRSIKVSRLDKLMFPDTGITKGDLIDYYAGVASRMVPLVRKRLMTLQRYPDGIDGEMFFSKTIPKYFPSWIDRATVGKKGGKVTHVVCNEKATLVYLANQACITMHVGLHRVGALDRPDQMIFDLDPATQAFGVVRSTAKTLRALLDDLGLAAVLKTSGSKGLHIVVPVRGVTFSATRSFARDVAVLLATREPRTHTIESLKVKRKGRLFLDWMRNGYGAHAVAPYSVRAWPGAPVAMPLEWSEIDQRGFNPRKYSIALALKRAEEPDPWAGWRRHARSLAGPRRLLDELLASEVA
jgi:bifunctional non-homologous end joining protein LigD